VAKAAAVQVEGAREVRRTLKKLGAGTRNMTDIHRKVAAMVVGPAQARTRRGATGKLAGSYKVRASAAKASVASNLVYAPVQEFGWPRHGITPSHALVGALEENRAAIADAYSKYVADLVERLNATG
jgi:phage gpG-like protein